MRCIHCGKPLGGRSTLCYGCASEGIDVEDVVDVDEDVRDRLERYVIVSSIRCAKCGDLHGSVEVDGRTYTADDFGIDTAEEWHLEMDKEEAWIRDHVPAVQHALVTLEDEWPKTVAAIREHVLR